MLSILKIDDRFGLDRFGLDRFGLVRAGEVVIPATYDAVWQLPGTFWGIRAGNLFGVLAADGSEVCPCVLPATYWGFAQVPVDVELEAALDTEATFLNYLQTRFVGLQTSHSHEGLFQPAKWWAETVTPHLVNEQGDLHLFAADRCLVLTQSGSWSWLDEAPCPCVSPLVCATQPPLAFTEIYPHESTGFQDADMMSMLYWRMSLTTHKSRDFTEEESVGLWMRQSEVEDREWARLEEAMKINGNASTVKQEAPGNMPALTPAVRRVCEDLLLQTLSITENTRAEMQHLIYLAWLWANGFVHFDGDLYMHTVAVPYHFDLAPLNLSKDDRMTTLGAIRQKYKLERLFPLLSNAPQAVSK